MENKGLTVSKWVLIVWPKIHQMPKNLSAKFVYPNPKVWDFNEKKASLGVRSPWIKQFDKKEQTKLPLERINNFWFAWLGRHFGVQFLSGLSSRGHHLRVQTFHLKWFRKQISDVWGTFFYYTMELFFRRFQFWFKKRRDLQEIPKSSLPFLPRTALDCVHILFFKVKFSFSEKATKIWS